MSHHKFAPAFLLAAVLGGNALADETSERAARLAAKTIDYLKSQQDMATGGWAVTPDAPVFPAITGLVVIGLADNPDIKDFDPKLELGVKFILSKVQPDGGIYDRLLPSYNTAICISALSKVKSAGAAEAIPPAISFLRKLQYSEAADAAVSGGTSMQVELSHPFYGGVGYGNNSRPDNSNLNFALQALQDAGVPGDDPFVQRALVFLRRTQMDGSINNMPYADGSRQGGLIYATAPSGDQAGAGQSQAGNIEETLDDGTVSSKFRAYGSMTYAGYKSFAYAELSPDDPRVVAARRWISENYSLSENPGMGTSGLYYFYMTFAKALEAWGLRSVDVVTDTGTRERDWREDLVNQLESLQLPDGSFEVKNERWMENNTVLISAYALIALDQVILSDPDNKESLTPP